MRLEDDVSLVQKHGVIDTRYWVESKREEQVV